MSSPKVKEEIFKNYNIKLYADPRIKRPRAERLVKGHPNFKKILFPLQYKTFLLINRFSPFFPLVLNSIISGIQYIENKYISFTKVKGERD